MQHLCFVMIRRCCEEGIARLYTCRVEDHKLMQACIHAPKVAFSPAAVALGIYFMYGVGQLLDQAAVSCRVKHFRFSSIRTAKYAVCTEATVGSRTQAAAGALT